MAHHAFLHFRDRRERRAIPRHAINYFPQHQIIEYPAAWTIAVDGASLAPGGERAGQGEARVVESLKSFEPLPGAIRIHGGLHRPRQRREFLIQPREAIQAIQRFEQTLAQRQQISHVIERVLDLLVRQRPLRPVGARVCLGEFDFEQPSREFAIADLRRKAGQRSGHLRVEHAADRSDGGQQHFQILARGMQYLDAGRSPERRCQRRNALEGDRIDAHGTTRPADLHEAELSAIGPLAHEFGVERECGLLGERGAEVGESGGVGDETSGRLHV